MAAAAVSAKVKHFIWYPPTKRLIPQILWRRIDSSQNSTVQRFAGTQSITRFAIIRFGNILGSSGSVGTIQTADIQRRASDSNHFAADVIRYFMTIPEAAQLVLQAGSIAKGGDIFVLDMGEPVKIVDLAEKMITLSGKKPVFDTERPAGAGEIAISITGHTTKKCLKNSIAAIRWNEITRVS